MKAWLFTVCCLWMSYSFAADAPIYSHKTKGAIKGADVVAYWSLAEGEDAVLGSDEFTYDWGGATWKFASNENRQAFIRNPERYVPQFGGYCTFSVANNFTNSIRPNSWSIIDGKLYLNFNTPTQRRFLKKTHELIKNAEANWPTVLKECEQDKKCNRY